MEKSPANVAQAKVVPQVAQLPRAYLNFVGRRILLTTRTIQYLGAFALITLGVGITKFSQSRRVMHPLIWTQIHRAGVRLMPIVFFVGCALGLVIIGQLMFQMARVGVGNLIGTIMVTAVVRELGPLITALLVLARIGTAIVIELGTARAMGEVEALEALGIDPIHYLVLPRVIGLAVSVFCLTVYLVLLALASGYGFAFLQDVSLPPMEYFHQLAGAVRWEDFALLGCKTMGFGVVIAVVTCFQGLAQPLRIEEVAAATTNAVVHSLVGCILLDALFIVIYLLI